MYCESTFCKREIFPEDIEGWCFFLDEAGKRHYYHRECSEREELEYIAFLEGLGE
jgi:hypothetical protein